MAEAKVGTRALLVYPEFPNTYWSFKHALPFVKKRSAYPPLGLLTLSSMLPASWEKRLVDMNTGKLGDADLDWADYVFASAMMVQQGSLREVLDRCKARGKPIAIGGPFVSTGAERLDDADHLFLGEAEDLVPGFLKDLEAGQAKHVYQTDVKPALTKTPVPDIGLVKMEHYSAMCVQFSRGCPFNCEFCDIIEIYGRVPRAKSNAQMIAEFDVLYRAGWRGDVFIVDDNFIGNKKNVRNLLPALCEWMQDHGHPFSLYTEASINLADDEPLLELMRKSNFRKVFIGIETPVEESLKDAQKTQNTRRSLMDSVRKIQSHGMEVMGGFIVGFDSDPDDIFQRQIDFITQCGIPMAMVGLLTALPDTQLWRRLHAENRLIFESSGNNIDARLNFVPKMDPATLVEGYKTVLRTLYAPAAYYGRALATLRNTITTGMPPNHRWDAANLFAFARIALKLGLLDSSRREFWRFLRRIFSERRDLLADAVRLAALGYHFRRVTEEVCDA